MYIMEVINLAPMEEIKVGSSLPGFELLMNDKKKTPSGSMNIDLGELDKL
jgi:hypothetical protein